MVRKAQLGALDRSFEIDRGTINEKERTVELSFSSETPVRRWFGYEVLDHKPGSVDLSRFKTGASLVVEHDGEKLCGVIEEARVDGDKKGRARVRFGTSAYAEEIFKDVREGIRRLVSIRYTVGKMVTEKVEDGVETLRATSWQPIHISLVADPADASVGVGRSAGNGTEHTETLIENNMKILRDKEGDGGGGTATATVNRAEVIAEGQRAERTRISGLRELADKAKKRFEKPDDIEAALRKAESGDTSVDDFRKELFEKLSNLTPVELPESRSATVGASKKEIKRYSIVRAIHQLAERKALDGIEREMSDAVAKNLGRDPKGFFIPTDIMARSVADSQELSTADVLRMIAEANQLRALTSNVFNAGGALVGTDLQVGSMIELLRNNMEVMALGARSLTGLVGDVAIPKQTGGATAYWLAIGAQVTRAQQTFGQLALTPHRLAACTAFDKQLMAQTSLSVEAFVRQDLMTVLAIEKDRAAINGSASGVAGEPVGILNTTGLSTTVTYATSITPTFVEIVQHETNLALNNAVSGSLGFLVYPTVRGKLKTTPKFSSTGTPIWENNTVNGYPARASLQVPIASAQSIFGNWADLIIADWDGLDVTVDPYTLVREGQIQIVIQMLTDIGIRHAESFSKGLS